MEKIKIQDNSNDRKYFTIVPNYILNHSTAIDQALYLQMKRYAGENNKCFATEQTLCKQLKIGRQALHTSLKYLIKHGWIEAAGLSGGKTRPIKTYKIKDIWKENIEYFKEIVSKRAVSFEAEDSAQKERDSVQNSSKIVSETAVEVEPIEVEPIKKNIATKVARETAVSYGNQDISNLITQLREKIPILDGSERENRRYCWLLLQKFKYKENPDKAIKGIEVLIEVGANSQFHAKNATSFKYLYNHAGKIIQEYKSRKPLLVTI